MQITIYNPIVGQVPNTAWDRAQYPTMRGVVAIETVAADLPDRKPANPQRGDWVVAVWIDENGIPCVSDAWQVLTTFRSRRDASLALVLPEETVRVVSTWGHGIDYDARNIYVATDAEIAASIAAARASTDGVQRMLANGDKLNSLAAGQIQADEDVA